MSIDDQATSDLALNDDDAENVVGGLKAKTAGTKGAPTYRVEVIDHAGGSTPTPVTTESMEDAQDC